MLTSDGCKFERDNHHRPYLLKTGKGITPICTGVI